MDEHDRYTRQRRLREIGNAGQERLERASVVVGTDRTALVELVYLQRAGVGTVTMDAFAQPRAFVHEATFAEPAARSHAAASWRALRTLVELVGGTGSVVRGSS